MSPNVLLLLAVTIQLVTSLVGLGIAVLGLSTARKHGTDIAEIKTQTNHMNDALREQSRQDRKSLTELTERAIDK